MNYNAADTRAIRKAQKAARQAEAERDLVTMGLVATITGRAYVHDLLVRCHIFSPSFNPSALAMAFCEGERNVGLQFLSDIMRAAPDQYVQMMREANDRHISDRQLGNNQNANGRDRQPGSAPGDDRTTGGVETDYDPLGELRGEDSPDGGEAEGR